MTELFVALPFVLAIVLALLLLPLGMLQYRFGGLVSPDTRVVVLLMLIALGAVLSIGFAARNLDETQLLFNSARLASEDAAGGFAASRIFSAVLVGAGFIEVLRGWLDSRRSLVADPARPVLMTLLGFYLGTLLIQGIASEVPSLSYKSLYPPIAVLAVYYQRVENLPRVIGAVKWFILAMMVGSYVLMVVKPDFVLQRPTLSVIPGIDFRLFGLTNHANTMGPVALLGIVLELAYPSRLRTLRWTQLVTCFVALVLAQSKTAWVAGFVMAAIIIVPLAMAQSPDPVRRRNDFSRSVMVLLAATLLLLAALLVFARFDVIDLLQRKVAGLDTLTGRTIIWKITLDAWKDNILFGYGAEIWGMERRLKFNMLYVGQAHNQFVQTLGDSGLAGLLLLLAYLGVLLSAALKWFVPSRGAIAAILALVLARCVTEAPMRTTDLLSWPLLTHLVVLILVCFYMRQSTPGLVSRRSTPISPFGITTPGGRSESPQARGPS